jgi:hypothetical protein
VQNRQKEIFMLKFNIANCFSTLLIISTIVSLPAMKQDAPSVQQNILSDAPDGCLLIDGKNIIPLCDEKCPKSHKELTYDLYRAIRLEDNAQILDILATLRKYYPCDNHCQHITDALEIATALNQPISFEFIRAIAMADPSAEDVAIYAGVALKRAVIADWDDITNKILKQSCTEQGKTIISDDFLLAALLSALDQESHKLIHLFIEHFGNEKIIQLIHLLFSKEMRNYWIFSTNVKRLENLLI